MIQQNAFNFDAPSPSQSLAKPPLDGKKKKKKGMFGGLFKKNKNKGKEHGGAFPSISQKGSKKGSLLGSSGENSY